MIKTTWIISDNDPSWTWPGFEGKPIVVEVYSSSTEVELFRNGVSLGRKPAGSEAGCIARFETEYQPGVLLAVSYESGAEIGCAQMETAGEPTQLCLDADPGTEELVFVNIFLRDAQGRVVPHQDVVLSVHVVGAQLIGLGSANPRFMSAFQGGRTETFRGYAQAILHRTGELATLSAGSETGLSSFLEL